MGSHPINLLIRFLLEISALVATGTWGWKQGEGWYSFLFAFGLPLILAIVWGTFAVPGDPSRSSSAPIITPGIIRLGIEMAIFVFATWALFQMGFLKASWGFGLIVALHYAVSYDRIAWLLSH